MLVLQSGWTIAIVADATSRLSPDPFPSFESGAGVNQGVGQDHEIQLFAESARCAAPIDRISALALTFAFFCV